MLYTRCPECRTIFRITAEILSKAEGQVRCGHCTHVFDANRYLVEPTEAAASMPAIAAAEPDAVADSPWRDPSVEGQSLAGKSTAGASVAGASTADTTVAGARVAGTSTAPSWMSARREPDARSTLWTAGVAIALLALIVQLSYHFRADLVQVPGLGALLGGLFAVAGIEIRPNVDLSQYELRYLPAVAQTNANAEDQLVITAELRNVGSDAQPYPHIFLTLEDRWEATIAGRYFAPSDYLEMPPEDAMRMQAGETVTARIVIVDPGPEAYGFEIDHCLPAQAGFICDNDAIFN